MKPTKINLKKSAIKLKRFIIRYLTEYRGKTLLNVRPIH